MKVRICNNFEKKKKKKKKKRKRKKDTDMDFIVKHGSKFTFKVTVSMEARSDENGACASASALAVKDALRDQHIPGIPSREMRLIFKGKELHDSAMVTRPKSGKAVKMSLLFKPTFMALSRAEREARLGGEKYVEKNGGALDVHGEADKSDGSGDADCGRIVAEASAKGIVDLDDDKWSQDIDEDEVKIEIIAAKKRIRMVESKASTVHDVKLRLFPILGEMPTSHMRFFVKGKVRADGDSLAFHRLFENQGPTAL